MQQNQVPLQVQGAQAGQFFLSPESAVTGVLDYSQKSAKRLYDKAIKPLFIKDELYQCEPEEMNGLLKAVHTRGNEFGWDDEVTGILHIPEDHSDVNSPTDYLPEEYGKISQERITSFEKSYLGAQTRAAQDSYMLYHCLLNSLAKEAKAKVQLFQSEYVVMNDAGTYIPSGNLLLKIIVRESHLDTNATTTSIRGKLSSLDRYINTVNNDVTKFNAYVKSLLMALSARGQRTEDLLANLFKGYMAVSDKVFISYISSKMEKYNEGKEIKPEELMQLANNKFRLMKENGSWEAPSAEEEKIMALEAEVRKMKKKGKSRTRPPRGKANPTVRHERTRDPGTRRNSKSGNPKGWLEKPNWMFTSPKKEDMHKPKTWNGKQWWWCGPESGGKCKPGTYRRHKPSECRGMKRKSTGQNSSEENNETEDEDRDPKRMKISQALSAVTEAESERSDSSGYESA